jgi:15-cis-phytoene synthase
MDTVNVGTLSDVESAGDLESAGNRRSIRRFLPFARGARPSSSQQLLDGLVADREWVTLDESYAICQQLNKRYGTTYYWSTHLLPQVKRPHVHALYGLCRYADDIVDDLGSTATVEERAGVLKEFGDRFFDDYAAGRSEHPVLKAVVHTVRSFDIDPDAVRRFLHSMTMDLSVATYETYADLEGYMDGSAAVIGEMMLPILEPRDIERARPHARDLGNAFQLTNFLRDVAEDLDRGRVYIPQEDLRRFGADPTRREVDPQWVELMKFEIIRCRRLYGSADLGIAMLPESSQRCIRAARDLYSGILVKIEDADYDVFAKRVRVSTAKKLAMAARLVTPRSS